MSIDVDTARRARKVGCAGCVWWNPSLKGDVGMCQVNPPRTSSVHKFPVTVRGCWCSSWMPMEPPDGEVSE